MYRIHLNESKYKNEYEELIKVFLRPSAYEILPGDSVPREKDEIKREIFHTLSAYTGHKPDWGILTGVRPVKLTGELMTRLGNAEKVQETLRNDYLVSEEKIELLLSIWAYQQEILGAPERGSVGVYVGIPFCPTRCLYCSFPSNQAKPEQIRAYLAALMEEIAFTGRGMREHSIFPESLYIGGGTPTTLSAEELSRLFAKIRESFDLSELQEFTVEAGRPDTITADKLAVIRKAGAGRISINPQSMKEETLRLIGRSHTPADIENAFSLTREAGIPMINTDLIAGLPGEEPADFADTLEQILRFDPENITVHTLATKRASRLIEEDSEYHYKQAEAVRAMLKTAEETLRRSGYKPYYLYRQKHMAGSFENTGWCKPNTAGIYNIRIMEEAQSIVALGAGGITKVYYPEENRLERVPNVTNYEIYIQRIKEMLERKEKELFARRKNEC